MAEPARLRRARPDERAALSALCVSAKAAWGYPPAFIERCRPSLEIAAEAIAAGRVLVAVDAADRPLGVAQLGIQDGRAELERLFVAPRAWRRGVGARLLRAMIAAARAAGCRELGLDADPNAAQFYASLGFARDGWAVSEVEPDRLLPRFRLLLPPADIVA
jgi:GNAT superfamily N-acetyltransferase